MTVKELRILVDNLDEYIHVPGGIERLKKTVLRLAISGQLVPQDSSEGTGGELYQQIQIGKTKLISEGKLKKQKPLPEITGDKIPFEIPKTWTWARLGNIGIVGTGATPSRDDHTYYGGTIPWVTSSLTSNDIILKTDEYITAKALKETNCSLYPVGSLVIAMYGQGKTRGQVAMLGVAAATNQACAVFTKLTRSELLEEYVRKVIEVSYETMRQGASGGAQPNLNVQKIKEIIIPLPSSSEQLRIIKKIGTIFKLIHELSEKYQAEQAERRKLTTSLLRQLSKGNEDLALKHLNEIIRTKVDAVELRKAILHLAISGQLVPQDPSEGTGEELHRQIQIEKQKLIIEGRLRKQKLSSKMAEDEIPFKIPRSWKWVRTEEIGQINPRNSAPDETDAGFIPMTMISEDYGVSPSFETRKWEAIKRGFTHFADGDVVMAKITPCFENSKAAVIGNLPSGVGAGTTELHVFRQKSSFVNPSFFYLWIKSPVYLESGRKKMTGSAGQKRVPTRFFANFPVPLPPIGEQLRIVQKTSQLLRLVAELEKSLGK
ncbi:MAG: restriction modification system specificity domain protein [Candidatus Saccharibacteria bacterium]|nr:restriction modification system specificity domain protein [Candidatus Saccharibacteria bacterium]